MAEAETDLPATPADLGAVVVLQRLLGRLVVLGDQWSQRSAPGQDDHTLVWAEALEQLRGLVASDQAAAEYADQFAAQHTAERDRLLGRLLGLTARWDRRAQRSAGAPPDRAAARAATDADAEAVAYASAADELRAVLDRDQGTARHAQTHAAARGDLTAARSEATRARSVVAAQGKEITRLCAEIDQLQRTLTNPDALAERLSDERAAQREYENDLAADRAADSDGDR